MAYNNDENNDEEVDEKIHTIFQIGGSEDIREFSDNKYSNEDKYKEDLKISIASDKENNEYPECDDEGDFLRHQH